jgi:CDP-glucose 4,6-dehydratase
VAPVAAEHWRGRRVLVTGHTGFKGGWLAVWLRHLGAEVSGFALAPATEPSLYAAVRLGELVDSTIGDVRDHDSFAACVDRVRPDVVFHLAAQALVGRGYEDPVGTFSTNVAGTAVVLDACRAQVSVRTVVVVTSDKCYADTGSGAPHRETDPLGGRDPYSASKAGQEHVAEAYQRSYFAGSGCGLARARAGNVFGGGDFTPGRLVADCLAALADGVPVLLRNPEAVRPWQHVLEPLSGYLLLAERLAHAPDDFSRPFNFGPEQADARLVREVVELCAEAWGTDPEWHKAEGDHPPETHVLQLDAALAREELGWQPVWRLHEGIERTVEWHRAFRRGEPLEPLMTEQIEAREAVRR